MGEGGFVKKNKRVPLYRCIWAKIRYWQTVQEIPDSELAEYLGVGERTLSVYDKSAEHVTLEKLDSFLKLNGMELADLLAL